MLTAVLNDQHWRLESALYGCGLLGDEASLILDATRQLLITKTDV